MSAFGWIITAIGAGYAATAVWILAVCKAASNGDKARKQAMRLYRHQLKEILKP